MIRRLISLIGKKFSNLYYCLSILFLKHSVIHSPLQLDGKKNFTIGKSVSINYKSWLAAMPLTGENVELVIDDGTVIGHFAHIYATKSIHIGKNVLIADKVYISDNLHGYEDIETPIMEQTIIQKNPVNIGDHSWICENVCIIGASVGKHCVIGANAVVTKDVPDYCVAVGVPAKIIKKFNLKNKKWEKI